MKYIRILFDDKVVFAFASMSLFLVVFCLGFFAGGASVSESEAHDTFVSIEESELSRLKETNEYLVETVGRLEDNINDLRNDVNRLRKERTEYEDKIVELEKENKILSNKLDKKNLVDYDYIINRENHLNSLDKEDIRVIKKYSKYNNNGKFTVNPHFVIAILYRESNFNGNATNSRAIGMGQLKINTAKYMRDRWEQDDVINKETLLNKELNLKYTTLFLNYLYDKYDGDYLQMTQHYAGARSTRTLNIYLNGVKIYLNNERNMTFEELINY